MNADARRSNRDSLSALIRVHRWLELLFVFSALLSPAWATDVPVLTVCEALQGRDQYNGKAIIVVGRSSSTDEGSWLSEECKGKIVTDGYTWANIVSTTYVRSQLEPPPVLPKEFKWDTDLMTNKLRDILKTTKLKEHGDRWVAIFGRFETRTPLQAVRGGAGQLMGYGFGHLNYAPAQLISSDEGFHELKAK